MNGIKGWWKLLFFVLTAWALAGCSQVSDLFSRPEEQTPSLPVVAPKASVMAEGRVVPERYVNLAFLTSGRLESLPAVEGASVEANALLASLGPTEAAQAEVRRAELELEDAQQALNQLNEDASLAKAKAEAAVAQARQALVDAQKAYDDTQTRSFRDQLDDKEEALQNRKKDLDDARETLDKYLNLDVNNPTRVNAQNDVDAREEDYQKALFERDQLASRQEVAKANLEAAREALKKAEKDAADLANGPDPDQKALAEKRVAAAQAQLDAAKRRLADMELRAPFQGVIAEVKPLTVGAWLNAGQVVVTLIDPSAWYVETTDLTERDVISIKEGDRAQITFDALPGEEVQGTVTTISRAYTEKSGDILYRVRLRLEKAPDGLRWGMTASVAFGEK